MNEGKLKELFDTRDSLLEEASKNIMDELSCALIGTEQFLNKQDKINGGILTWEGASYLTADESHPSDYILLSGQVTYAVGTDANTSTCESVTVTETNQEYFTKVVRIGFPNIIDS